MKYFTKDWYKLSQKTDFHLLLEEEKQADTFSEEYFQHLYDSELNSWLKLQEEVASILESNEVTNTDDNNEYQPFNRKKATEQFHEGFIYNKEYFKKELPSTILQEIADIRVFTLNKATRLVIEAVTNFCEENEKSVSSTSKNYRKYMEEASNTFDKGITENFGFHDCTIIKTVQEGTSLKLLFDNSGGFTDIDEVTFKDFNIVKQEGSLKDSWWLYEEVYKVNDKYEFHALLQNKEMGLTDLIISADQVFFKRNQKN